MKKKNQLFGRIARVEEISKIRKLELKNFNTDIKLSDESSLRQLFLKAKKNVDLEDLKSMVYDSIVEFKKSKGFLREDFDTNKELNQISKVKYDLYSFITKKNK